MKKILFITIPILIFFLLIISIFLKFSAPNEDQNKCKELINTVKGYNNEFVVDNVVLTNTDTWGKRLQWEFKIKNNSQLFTEDIIKECNNIKNDIQKFLNDNPDYFLNQEKYKVNLCFTYDKTFNGINICNFINDNTFPIDGLCVLGLTCANDYHLYKYLDNITIIDAQNIYDEQIKYLKEMQSLRKIYLRSILSRQLQLLKEQLPECEIIYSELDGK